VDTGQSHFSKQNLDLVVDRIREQSPAALRAWRRLEMLAYQGRELLLSGQSASAVAIALGELLEENWRLELELTQGAVQLAQLEAVQPQLRDLGHGKLTGAGAGGHYFFIANSLSTKSEALRVLKQAGFQPVSWTIDRRPARLRSMGHGR
jgi:galactokinase/mevalonate kinase-like predicted kinase